MSFCATPSPSCSFCVMLFCIWENGLIMQRTLPSLSLINRVFTWSRYWKPSIFLCISRIRIGCSSVVWAATVTTSASRASFKSGSLKWRYFWAYILLWHIPAVGEYKRIPSSIACMTEFNWLFIICVCSISISCSSLLEIKSEIRSK